MAEPRSLLPVLYQIRISEVMARRLRQAALRQGVRPTDIVRSALVQALACDTQEELADGRKGEETYASIE